MALAQNVQGYALLEALAQTCALRASRHFLKISKNYGFFFSKKHPANQKIDVLDENKNPPRIGVLDPLPRLFVVVHGTKVNATGRGAVAYPILPGRKGGTFNYVINVLFPRTSLEYQLNVTIFILV